MGREKRIAESRTKDILDRGKTTETPRANSTAASTAAPVATPPSTMSTGRALWHILLLFIVPAVLLVVLGKLLFHL
jgi:hypothetical protein